jgi:hypothetical protein
MHGWAIARRRRSVKRIHATAHADFFHQHVARYPDKQYETWLGAHFTQVGVDYAYSKDLQDKIYAGIANHFFGMSFSNSLKLVKDKDRNDGIPRFERVYDAVEAVFYSTSFSFLSAKRPKNVNDGQDGIVHAELFLLRLLTSLQAARRLINWGYFSEPLTILRSSLEQLAWSYAVGVKLNKAQIDKPQASKCIGQLKERFPSAGTLYGALSHFSHMNFEAQKHFVIRGEVGSGVMQQSAEFKFFGLLFYSFVLIAYQYVCRDLRRIYTLDYHVHYDLRNTVLPLRLLVEKALMRSELDGDEVAAMLSSIYFETFGTNTR